MNKRKNLLKKQKSKFFKTENLKNLRMKSTQLLQEKEQPWKETKSKEWPKSPEDQSKID